MSDEKAYCWVVASGDYSDVQTHGIYTTEAAADAAVAAAEAEAVEREWGTSDFRIEHWPMNTWGTVFQSVERITQIYSVDMYPDGKLAGSVCPSDGHISTMLTSWKICGVRTSPDGIAWPPELQVKCVARTEKQAIKIANDIRIQLLAANEWVVGTASLTKTTSNGDGKQSMD